MFHRQIWFEYMWSLRVINLDFDQVTNRTAVVLKAKLQPTMKTLFENALPKDNGVHELAIIGFR